MLFNSFSSIENSYNTKVINRMIATEFATGEWVATEKVHGANFAIWIDNDTDELRFARGNAFLEEGEQFFGYEAIAPDLAEKARTVAGKISEGRIVTIFGELAGGHYTHSKVANTNLSAVQGGVYYSPELIFLVFDIRVDDVFLGYEEVVRLARLAGFNLVPEIARGSFGECLKLDEKFITKVPDIYGLPEIEDNFAEGLVIKPVEHRTLLDGSRGILKKKTEKFSERKVAQTQPARVPTTETEILIVQALEFCVPSRLDNVISKVGGLSKETIGEICRAFSVDAFDDFIEEYRVEYDQLNSKNQRMVSKAISRKCNSLIAEYKRLEVLSQ